MSSYELSLFSGSNQSISIPEEQGKLPSKTEGVRDQTIFSENNKNQTNNVRPPIKVTKENHEKLEKGLVFNPRALSPKKIAEMKIQEKVLQPTLWTEAHITKEKWIEHINQEVKICPYAPKKEKNSTWLNSELFISKESNPFGISMINDVEETTTLSEDRSISADTPIEAKIENVTFKPIKLFPKRVGEMTIQKWIDDIKQDVTKQPQGGPVKLSKRVSETQLTGKPNKIQKTDSFSIANSLKA